MTPTEQDKELREQIHSALFADDFPILNDIEKNAVDRVVAIIQAQKADMKRVALEARIETVTYIESMLRFENIPLHPVQAESLKQYLRQLEAQQEEV